MSETGNEIEEAPPPIKIALCGPAGAGKTQLLQFLTEEKSAYDPRYIASIGVEFRQVKVDQKTLHIWDLAGDKKYESVILNYMKHSSVVAICVGLDTLSLGEAQEWYTQVKSSAPDSQVVLVATKCDLIDEKMLAKDSSRRLEYFQQEQYEENLQNLKQFAANNGLRFYQTNAIKNTVAWTKADGQPEGGNIYEKLPKELISVADQFELTRRVKEKKDAPQPPSIEASPISNYFWATLKYLYFIVTPVFGVYVGMTKLAPSILSGSLPLIATASAAVISPLFAYLFENKCKDWFQRHKGTLVLGFGLLAAFGFTFLSWEMLGKSPVAIASHTGGLVVSAATIGATFLNIIGISWLVNKISPPEKLRVTEQNEVFPAGLEGVSDALKVPAKTVTRDSVDAPTMVLDDEVRRRCTLSE